MGVKEGRRLVKLVRDKVERFCGGDMAVRYELMSKEEHRAQLRKKLIEEAAEYLVNPCVEELADVVEVVDALARYDLGITITQLGIVVIDKRRDKGGFDGGLGMYLHIAEEHR